MASAAAWVTRAERIAACRRVLADYAPEAASVADMRAYARCVDLVHGTGDGKVILGWMSITFVLSTFAGAIFGYRRPVTATWDRSSLVGAGAVAGATVGALLAILLMGVALVL